VALDFELWSKTSTDIQRAHLEHFAFLLRASRYKKFTIKMRLSKLGIVRKLLIPIQSAWYPQESISLVINTLVLVAQSSFIAEVAIKPEPIVSYIAATLAEGGLSHLQILFVQLNISQSPNHRLHRHLDQQYPVEAC
jgi:hypothetical protein